MTIYGSYSDFTTKGHGVIEGLSGSRKGKTGPIYSKVPYVPNTHTKVSLVDEILEISSHIAKMKGPVKSQLERDLYNGYTVKLRGSLYVKKGKRGKYEIYANPSEQKTSSKSKHKVSQKNPTFDETYARLIAIKKKANS